MKKIKIFSFNIIRLILVLALTLLLGFGCSGGSDDNTTSSNGTTGNGNNNMEAALSATVKTLSNGEKDRIVSEATNDSPLLPGSRRVARQDINFSCGTYHIGQNGSFTVTYNGSCGISGSVTGSMSNDNSMTMTYDNVTTEDGCTINGNITMTFDQSGTEGSVMISYDNLSVCGQTVTGSVNGTYDSTTGEFDVNLDGESVTISSDGETTTASIDTNLTFDESSVEGSTQVTIENETYTCTVQGVVIDPECGLPTSGTIQISDGTETITIDFSNTSCSNPTVSYTYNGELVIYNLGVDVEI